MTAEAAPNARPKRRSKTLQRLLASVEELLASGTSYTDLSVETIISRADIARSTFYAHYDGKAALLRDLGSDVITQLIAASAGWAQLPDDGTKADLEKVFADLFVLYRAHAGVLSAMVEGTTDEGVRTEFFRMIETGQKQIGEHVKRGKKAGSVRDDADATTVVWLIWMIERCLYEVVRKAVPRSLPKHARALTAIVWSSLYEGARPEG